MEAARRQRPVLRPLIAVLISLVAALATVVGTATTAAAALTVTVINTDGEGIASRSAPQIAAVNGYGAPANATVVANCWTWGDAVGPYANRLWWQITYAGRTFYAADRYLSTPNIANQPPAGQPQCGTAPAPPPPPPAAGGSVNTPVWIGAPYAGNWPGTPRPNDARPGAHGPVFGGDWAMDFYQIANTRVNVYVAPKNSALASGITAKVIGLGATCASGGVAAGGYNVKVGVFDRGVQVGWVSYAHVQPIGGLALGSPVNRWGGQIGTVGSYTYKSCYQVSNPSGQHVHMEAYNVKNYSCYRSLASNAAVGAGEYMGYLGGTFGPGACPAGA